MTKIKEVEIKAETMKNEIEQMATEIIKLSNKNYPAGCLNWMDLGDLNHIHCELNDILGFMAGVDC